MRVLCSLVRRTTESLVTVGLADPRVDGSLLRLVDHGVPVPDDYDAIPSALDVVSWAEAIIAAVHGVEGRDARSSESQTAGVFRS